MEKHGRARKRAIYSPFISAGVISVERLKNLVETMEANGAKNVKLSGEIIFVWDRPDFPDSLEEKVEFKQNQFRFGGVRPVKMCSAETFCERYQQPVLDLAYRIDKLYHDTHLEMKLVIGVAGCQRSCSEPSTKDIGVIAHPTGFEMLVGGAAGLQPKIGRRLAIIHDADGVIETIGRILEYCKKHGRRHSRLGKIIAKRGMDDFKNEVLDANQLVTEPSMDENGISDNGDRSA